ncbi:unnamed protein product [Fraxinus pennsylvanica]|uniref:Uncharacterized protein n=1 Tax=Fraxinus pennsylvanica TaxID=56036 RepID=A0AAD2AFH3_9LAMI|nr:unnamed protein product [Fraxinus pennsylvanica]
MRKLAKAIERFGEIYERVESMKQRQMVELEKQRMQFAKDLEVQRMQLFMDTQVQLEKIKQRIICIEVKYRTLVSQKASLAHPQHPLAQSPATTSTARNLISGTIMLFFYFILPLDQFYSFL